MTSAGDSGELQHFAGLLCGPRLLGVLESALADQGVFHAEGPSLADPIGVGPHLQEPAFDLDLRRSVHQSIAHFPSSQVSVGTAIPKQDAVPILYCRQEPRRLAEVVGYQPFILAAGTEGRPAGIHSVDPPLASPSGRTGINRGIHPSVIVGMMGNSRRRNFSRSASCMGRNSSIHDHFKNSSSEQTSYSQREVEQSKRQAVVSRRSVGQQRNTSGVTAGETATSFVHSETNLHNQRIDGVTAGLRTAGETLTGNAATEAQGLGMTGVERHAPNFPSLKTIGSTDGREWRRADSATSKFSLRRPSSGWGR